MPISSFQHLVNPMWPHKHVPKKKIQPLMMKERLSHVSHEYQHVYQHSNSNQSGDQSLQVFNYQLVTSKQIKWNSQLASQHIQGIPLVKWIFGPLVLANYKSMMSL